MLEIEGLEIWFLYLFQILMKILFQDTIFFKIRNLFMWKLDTVQFDMCVLNALSL